MKKKEKGKKTEGFEPSNQRRVRTLRNKENYKYLAILGADTIKQREMKEKVWKEYQRTRKLPETKHSSENLIKKINTQAVFQEEIYPTHPTLTECDTRLISKLSTAYSSSEFPSSRLSVVKRLENPF